YRLQSQTEPARGSMRVLRASTWFQSGAGQRRQMQRISRRDRLSKSTLPACGSSSSCRPPYKMRSQHRTRSDGFSNPGAHTGEKRMANAKMQVFDNLHVVARHDDAGLAQSPHVAACKPCKSSGHQAGLLGEL